MGFPSEDRMLETPYCIVYALCRLPIDDPKDREALRQMAPLIMANLPGDHDTFMLYEPEHQELFRSRLDSQLLKAGYIAVAESRSPGHYLIEYRRLR